MEGKIFKLLEERSGVSTGGQKPWIKREVVVKITNGDFLVLTAWGDAATALKTAKDGQDVEFEFSVKSREYKDKWYTDCTVTKITFPGKYDDIPTEPGDLPF